MKRDAPLITTGSTPQAKLQMTSPRSGGRASSQRSYLRDSIQPIRGSFMGPQDICATSCLAASISASVNPASRRTSSAMG